jgi:hypothetical protein
VKSFPKEAPVGQAFRWDMRRGERRAAIVRKRRRRKRKSCRLVTGSPTYTWARAGRQT